MRYQLVIKEEAVLDIQEAYNFYEDHVTNLGARFLQELEEHLFDVSAHPEHYSYWYNQNIFRSHSLLHFPFSIIYEINQEEVIVYALHDHRRDPAKTIKRF